LFNKRTELTAKEFNGKVGTILETAKQTFKETQAPMDEHEISPFNSERSASEEDYT